MEADSKELINRVYNIQSCSFTVNEVVQELKNIHPNFKFSVK
jgi:hypothetical protein